VALALVLGCTAAPPAGLPAEAEAKAGQEAPEEKKLRFQFKDASADAVLQYVSSVTGWIFVQEKRVTGTIDAVSDTEVPVSKVLDFLNAALRRHGATILNPYSPGLPKPGQVLKVQDVDAAKRLNLEIYSGSNPDEIPVSDQMRTQIVPLKAVNVVEVQRELGEVLRAAMGDGGQVSVSSYSNSVILVGRSDGINRAVRILRVIDVSASAELKVRVFPLKNADAAEVARVLNDVFRKEAVQGQMGQQAGFNIWRMFGGGERERSREGQGPQPRALAHEMVRITADPRTNSIIVTATEDNIKVIEDLLRRLDDRTAAALRLKLYPLRYADATAAAKLLNDLFAPPPSSGGSGGRGGDRGGGDGRRFMPMWLGGPPPAPESSVGATQEVRAVADIRTNSVLVAAAEPKLQLIDAILMELDRQVNDLLVVKIYELKNADPAQMATILQALFKPQQTASPGGTGASGRAPAHLPSQQVDVTHDVRTRSVIVKASREHIDVIDEVVRQLDANPTESVSTYYVPLKNHTAYDLAVTLQNLLRGTGTPSGANLQPRTQTPLQPGGFGSTGITPSLGTRGGTSGRTMGSTRTRGGFLGPLDGQEAPPEPVPQEEEPRRGIEGQVDIQPDPATNGLLIRTSPRNFQAIQALLQDLDRLRPQVLIKVLIADVTLDESSQFGLEGFWENKMRVRGGDLARNRFGTDFALATQGFTYLLAGDEFQATLNLLAREGRLRVLATPRILALDNATASINVGKEVPRITNTQINQLGNTVNTVQYESVGILLQVTPHINPDGLVTLEVAPEISDVASAAESVPIAPGVTSPTFNVNSALTTVAVRSGTTVVIGGLIRESTDHAVEKVPLLGDIPVLGALFSNTTQRKVKRELMIFLTPYVAYTASQLEELTQIEKAKLKLLDPRDIEAESDRWLERVRR
jgi:general secretion pathway protein D